MKYTYDKDICVYGHDKVDTKSLLPNEKQSPNLKVLRCKKCGRIWTIKI